MDKFPAKTLSIQLENFGFHRSNLIIWENPRVSILEVRVFVLNTRQHGIANT